MTTFYSEGDAIRGEKIYTCFGSPSFSKVKTKYRGSLGLNGWATVLDKVRPSTSGRSDHSDTIVCQSAAFECTKRPKAQKALPCGNHRCRPLLIKRKAVCTITIPAKSQPAA